jgi:hypothetical protein
MLIDQFELMGDRRQEDTVFPQGFSSGRRVDALLAHGLAVCVLANGMVREI